MTRPAAEAERDVTVADVREARRRTRDVVRETPVLSSRSISAQVGGSVLLKAENLQRTGSFKVRGALNTVRQLDDVAAGVVAGSAGNHAQALAYAARSTGTRCRVYMPDGAALSKVAAASALDAEVLLGGSSVDECVDFARDFAAEEGAAFVPPFDHPHVVAGQGTLGLELLEQVPDLAQVVVPLGGGGLAAGVALAVKDARPQVEICGVQVQACAAFPASLAAGRPVGCDAAPTLADGIAIKRPGGLTLPLLARWMDDVVVVEEDEVASAMVLLLERSKLVVEGAGAVGLAALLAGRLRVSRHGPCVVILSGGNVDSGVLAAVARRGETAAGRRLRFYSKVPDSPGGLAALLAELARARANLLQVEHVRDGVELPVGQTGVEVAIETRGAGHADEVLRSLRGAGYSVRVEPLAAEPG